MKNSTAPLRARSKSSTFLPLQSAKRQTFNEINQLNEEKIDPVEALPRMINKLHIDESTEEKITNKLVQETAIQKEVVERVHNLRSITIPSYDIDGMTTEELQASLCSITEDAQQPFSFLANISKEFARDYYHLSMKANKSTDIDIQLATTAKRIETCKILLEKTKSCVQDTSANPDDIRRSLGA